MTNQYTLKQKRDLLPLWIKIFLWLFLIMGCLMPIIIILGIINYPTNLAIYGFESNSIFSTLGFIIACLISYKSIIAYGLWTGKKWAVIHAINDAYIGIISCVIAMILPLFLYNGFNFTFRLELIALVPYLFKMKEIKNIWNGEIPTEPVSSENVDETDKSNIELEPKNIIYKKYNYKCDNGILIIEQEFQNPNIGEKVFLDDKPAPYGKYKLGFMSHILVDNGVIESISNF